MKQKHTRKGTKRLLMLGCLFALLFSGSGVYAQGRQITGVVSDASGPMTGVVVSVQGTTSGVLTNMEGRYAINAAPGQTLLFNFTGYAEQVVAIGAQSVIDVTMESTAIGLDEAVAIGYGVVRKRDLTGAVQSVKDDVVTMVYAQERQ